MGEKKGAKAYSLPHSGAMKDKNDDECGRYSDLTVLPHTKYGVNAKLCGNW